MSNDSKISVLDDGWMQVFTLLLIVSGIFSLHYMLRRTQPQPQQAVAQPALPAAVPTERPAAPAAEAQPAPVRQAVPAAAEPPPQAAAEKPAETRTPGRWVVGKPGAAGVNCTSLGDAVTRAADGDSIVVQPGSYEVSVLSSKSLTISGGGTSPEEVELTNSLSPTFAVAGGRVVMENLTVSNNSQMDYWALSVSQASLALRNVTVKSTAKGVKVQSADLEASDCEFDASSGLSISGKSRVKLTGVSITGRLVGVSMQDSQADLELNASHISGGGAGLRASDGAWARISGTTISGNRYAGVMVASGAEVRMSKSQLSGNGDCGAYIEENGKLVLEKVSLTHNKCGVGFAGAGTLDARGNKFADNSMGAVAVSPLEGDKAVITGYGNSGLLVPGEKRPAAKKRGTAAARRE